MASEQKKWPAWAPVEIKEWFDRIPEPGEGPQGYPQFVAFVEKLATDLQMLDFWRWHQAEEAAILNKRKAFGKHKLAVIVDDKPKIIEQDIRESWHGGALSVCFAARDATHLPHKPGNMTPGQRKMYFEKVRKHVNALMKLLGETCFDRGPSGPDGETLRELDEEELALPLEDAFKLWGKYEDNEHVFAFVVRNSTIYEFPLDYSETHFMEFLHGVNEWTELDDYWTDLLRSSKPVTQANTANAKVIYFTRTIYTKLRRYGLTVPFNLLASLTNVALDLPADQMVDEETVRKQVRRYEQKLAERESQHASAFNDTSKNNDRTEF